MPVGEQQITTGCRPPKTRKRNSTETDKLDAAFNILTTAIKKKKKTLAEPNECQLFGNLVASKLQKYSPTAQTAVQEAIMQILFRVDRGYYNAHASQIPLHVNTYPNSSSTSTHSHHSTDSFYLLSLSPASTPNTQHSLLTPSPSTITDPSTPAFAAVQSTTDS